MRILSLLAVVLAGCYDPVVNDCQFTCPDGFCPGGSQCFAGLCRVNGATGSCSCSTPPDGCSLVPNTSGLCLAECKDAQATWSEGKDACAATGRWQLAVLGTTLVAAESSLPMATSWIGLTRDSIAQEWRWADGSGSIAPLSMAWSSGSNSGVVNTCAALSGGKLYSDGCGAAHAYACTPN